MAITAATPATDAASGPTPAPEAAPAPAVVTGQQAPQPNSQPSPQPAETRSEAPAGSPSPSQTPTLDDDTFWRRLDEVDPDEVIRRSRRLAGKVGSEADRLADKRLQQRQVEETRRKAIEDRRRLRDEDPLGYVEREKQEEAEAERLQAMWGEVDAALVNNLWKKLPEAVQSKLGNKTYAGSPAESRVAFIEDVLETLAEMRSTEAVRKAEADWNSKLKQARKDATEAGRLDALADANADDSPDTGGGVPAAGALTWGEYQRHRGDAAWRKANSTRIEQFLNTLPKRRG
jgi:hypothetical protein